ncbi:SIR2 family protein [Dictyobacter arantiisoli]|uniref:SIR2-like domain-containing protein n=1 Tax=Dictyobacter arantiisoli TaxID=2014874 RepID=A0A5A5TBN5_9CHLR|nr:SIR2 family protein [Dictyobacter arantiisoli]GCF08433.1 hypothetical protein KDI_19970 [Dictyobacter arantiisoli]
MPDPQPITIEEIVKRLDMEKLNGNPTTLLLGSRAGGLFRSAHFYTVFLSFGDPGYANLSPHEKFKECYNLFHKYMRQSSETSIHALLQASVKDLEISKGDVGLVELVQQGYFSEIITTNIDDQLEKAFQQAGLREPFDVKVILPDKDIQATQYTSKYRITKVYGDLLSRRYDIKVRLDFLDGEHRHELETYLRRALAQNILMIGIDPSWDADILSLFPEKAGTIWFINEEDLQDKPLIAHLFAHRTVSYLTGPRGSYENFINILYRYLGPSVIPIHHKTTFEIMALLEQIRDEQQKTREIIDSTVEKFLTEMRHELKRSLQEVYTQQAIQAENGAPNLKERQGPDIPPAG